MEKQRWEESEKRRAEERRSEKRKSQKKEDAGARKGRKLTIHCFFFQWFVAPESQKVGSLKRRVRRHLARWEMKNCTPLWREAHLQVKKLIKGPDNPTSQFLPRISNKCCSGDGEGRKDKRGGGGSRSKTSCMWKVVCVCVTKLYVKDGVWQRKMVCVCVCDKVVCVCEKDGVWQSGAWKMVAKEGVWQNWVWK